MSSKKWGFNILFVVFLLGLFFFRQYLPGFTAVPEDQVLVVTETINHASSLEKVRSWHEGHDTVLTGLFNTYLYDKQMRVVWEGQSSFLEGTPCKARTEVIFDVDPKWLTEIHSQYQGAENLKFWLQHHIFLFTRVLTYGFTIEDCLNNLSEDSNLCFPEVEDIQVFSENLTRRLPQGIRIQVAYIQGFEPPQHFLDKD